MQVLGELTNALMSLDANQRIYAQHLLLALVLDTFALDY